jgi:serine/threonine protein phosphatase PrpC
VRHSRNEDAVAVAASTEAGLFAALVVCDGVSSAPDSDQASLDAARAARDVLAVSRHNPGDGVAEAGGGDDAGDSSHEDAGKDPQRAMAEAGAAAHAAASAVARRIAGSGRGNPPSTTLVAAVLHGRDALVGWVGDSRAYWVPDGGPAEQLSVDDSWAAEAIALGVPREEAESGPKAHAITRWLGADAPEPRPRTLARRLEGAGWLLLCSDGLWNYCSEAGALGKLVAETWQHAPEPRELAEALVQWAVEAGGADNISVALARVED